MQYNPYWHSNPQYHSQQMHAVISLQTRCGQATSDDTSTFGTCYEDQVFFRGSIFKHISHIAQDKTCLLPNFRLLQEPGHLVLCVSSMPKFGSRGRHVVTFPGTRRLILMLSGRCYGHAENRS